jgi:hypothetical protein
MSDWSRYLIPPPPPLPNKRKVFVSYCHLTQLGAGPMRDMVDMPEASSLCLILGPGPTSIHARPIPRLWPCSSSAGRPPRAEPGSTLGIAGCCSGVSVAMRCELSRLRLRASSLLSFV